MIDIDYVIASLRRALRGDADDCVRRVGVRLSNEHVELTFEIMDGPVPEYHDQIDIAVTEVMADTIASWGDIIRYSLVTQLTGPYSVILRREAAPDGSGFVFVAEGDYQEV
jgi:hypothetical protein